MQKNARVGRQPGGEAAVCVCYPYCESNRGGSALSWSEVDLEKRVWTIPAERMKASVNRRVPLATETLQVLADAQELADGSGLRFPSPHPTRLGPLGTNTLSRLCHDLRLGCTPHGMRSSFRTWCGEAEQPREPAEQALAHVNPNWRRGVEARQGRLHALRLVRTAVGADASLERLPVETEREEPRRRSCIHPGSAGTIGATGRSQPCATAESPPSSQEPSS